MKIGNSFSVNFKSLKRPENQEEQALSSKGQDTFATPSSDNLRAYGLASCTLGKGIEKALVKPDYDSNQLIYTLKAPDLKTQQVKFIYKIGNDEAKREAFSTPKDLKTGVFKIAIPVLNRKDNSIVKKLTIDSVEYFDETNLKIGSESPEDMTINPNDMMTVKETRTTIIDDEISDAAFDSISQGVSEGRLVEMEYEDIVRYKGNEPIVAILPSKEMNNLLLEIASGTFTLPMNVKGIIASPDNYKQGSMLTDCLGHAVSRLRGRKTFALVAGTTMDKIKEKYLNNPENPYFKIDLGLEKMKISGLKELPKPDVSKVKVPQYKFVNRLMTPDDEEFSSETVGLKAYNLGLLKKMQSAGGFKVPSFFVLPSGVWNEVKKSPDNAETYGTSTKDVQKIGGYHFCVQKANASENPINELKGLRRLITDDLILPKEIRTQLKDKAEEVFDIPAIIKNNGCLIARSSFNGEDSDTMATQGLYDSFPGIRTAEQLYRGVKEVQASKWSDLAYWSRRNHGIDHADIQGNVIIQEVVPVDYTFTINTADPRRNNKNKIVIQLSQGVYSCFPNTPYIFEYDKTTGEITRKTLAKKKRTKPIEKVVMDDFANLKYDLADYSNDPLNMSKKDYEPVLRKVFEVAQFIEDKFGGKPQDIEGGIIFKQNEKTGALEPEIHIWQTRDVHLIKR